jgi:hypothetical protein
MTSYRPWTNWDDVIETSLASNCILLCPRRDPGRFLNSGPHYLPSYPCTRTRAHRDRLIANLRESWIIPFLAPFLELGGSVYAHGYLLERLVRDLVT